MAYTILENSNKQATMTNKSVGFSGGGRVTRILPGGLKRARQLPDRVVVNDSNVG